MKSGRAVCLEWAQETNSDHNQNVECYIAPISSADISDQNHPLAANFGTIGVLAILITFVKFCAGIFKGFRFQ
jgi:hypothetical protein